MVYDSLKNDMIDIVNSINRDPADIVADISPPLHTFLTSDVDRSLLLSRLCIPCMASLPSRKGSRDKIIEKSWDSGRRWQIVKTR